MSKDELLAILRHDLETAHAMYEFADRTGDLWNKGVAWGRMQLATEVMLLVENLR